MPCVILSLNHCQSTSDSFQYCICRRSVSGECRSGQLGVQAVTWQLLVQYVCYHIHICFSSRSHPRSCQLSQAELSRNAWYAELSKSIIQPVWMCIAEFPIGISFIQCTMLLLSTKSCLKSSKLRPILIGQFCHAISKNICLNVLGSNQPWEILVFVIFKL